jgi:site-specific DNA-methyltransferase (adenine-specific)
MQNQNGQIELFDTEELFSSVPAKSYTPDGNRLKVHFMSEHINWATPQAIFDKLNAEFDFTLDPCADISNAKCKKFYTLKENGLAQDWSKERVFMNPPYGKEISKWIKKAYQESKKGALVICLIPSRTDTKWWHDFVLNAKQIRFIKGRLSFNDGDNTAPFPSAIIVFDGRGV